MPSPRVTRESLLAAKPKTTVTKEIEVPGRGSLVIQSFTKGTQRRMQIASEETEGVASDQLFELNLIKYGVVEPELDDALILEMFESWEAEEVDYLLEQIITFNNMRKDSLREEVGRFRSE